jgi:hypothetical protein
MPNLPFRVRWVVCRWTSAVFLAFILATASRTTRAAPVCLPVGGGGVPGQPGLPDWWTAAAPFDDPRWIGSYGFGEGNIKLSALVQNTGGQAFLLLKWRIAADPGIAAPGDRIIVGFFDPGTTKGTIFWLTREAIVTTAAGSVGSNVMTLSAYERTGTSGVWMPSSPPPTTVNANARLDATCGIADPIVCNEWIVRLRIPLTEVAGGIAPASSFKMWYEADVNHGGVDSGEASRWPNGAAAVDDAPVPPTFPEPNGTSTSAAWNSVTIGGGCSDGIEIETSDITVSNSGFPSETTRIDVDHTNTFKVTPKNQTTGTSYAANAIKANLRIADWGSAVGNSPRWITVPSPPGGCGAATGSGFPVAPTSRFDLECTWTPTAAQKCAYRPDLSPPNCTADPGPRYKHQCIMAALEPNSAASVSFLHESAWNNFNFGPASKLEEKARIDIGTRSPRDVYLYVKTSNMPAVIPPRLSTEAPGAAGPALKERLGVFQPGRVGAVDAARLQALVANGTISYEDIEKVMPTQTVYVWNDTGTTIHRAGRTIKVLEAQPSFTLFVWHDGPLSGWRHSLRALAGATLTEIAPDFYKIAVGSSGSVEVLTTIASCQGSLLGLVKTCGGQIDQVGCAHCDLGQGGGQPGPEYAVGLVVTWAILWRRRGTMKR